MATKSHPDRTVAGAAADVASSPAPEGGAGAPQQRTPAVVRTPRTPEPSGAPGGLLAVIERLAVNPQLNMDVFDRLLKARHEEEDRAAERAFYAALAAAKGEWGPIIKTRVVDYPHKERDDREAGGRTKYKYEELADISAVVDPILAKHGLSYRHKALQNGDKITVTCTLSHADGHSESNSLEGFKDTSGQKNPNQAIASTVTYLQRYTLKEALGIGAGRDDDAGGFDDPMITADDVVYIEQLIADTASDLDKLLKTVGAESVADMRASQFKQASWLLETVKRRLKAGGAKAADQAAQSEAADGTTLP